MEHKKFAVILSGCGVYDGAEINEVVLTLLALEENNIEYQCFAPDIDQYHVVNHLTGEANSGKRNVFEESARIVRGSVKKISECVPSNFDGLIVPGGFGVAKNLSSFAFKGENLDINPTVFSTLNGFKELRKPVGYMCIAPVLLPVVYGSGVILTVGNDADTISLVENMGGVHKIANVYEIVVDEHNKIVTTPAYMLARNISEAKAGIDKLIAEVRKMS